MPIFDTERLESLEQQCSVIFLVAGGSLVVHSVIHVLIAFTSVGYPFHHEFPFGVAGMILGFVGLFGLYPRLVARSRMLANIGAVVAGLGMVGWIGLGLGTLIEELGATPPAWLDTVAPLVIFGVILGYLVFAIVGVRTETVSRTTALVVVTPALVMVYNIASALILPDFTGAAVIVAGGFALAHLAIGAALRVEEFPTAVDPATGLAT